MTKKLTKYGDDLALILEKPILKNLGLTEKTDLDVIIVGDVLLIKPRNNNEKSATDRQDELEKTATSIMDKYEKVFKKLAKT